MKLSNMNILPILIVFLSNSFGSCSKDPEIKEISCEKPIEKPTPIPDTDNVECKPITINDTLFAQYVKDTALWTHNSDYNFRIENECVVLGLYKGGGGETQSYLIWDGKWKNNVASKNGGEITVVCVIKITNMQQKNKVYYQTSFDLSSLKKESDSKKIKINIISYGRKDYLKQLEYE